MTVITTPSEPTIMIRRMPHMISLVLNRPRVLNSLDIEMIRTIENVLDDVERSEDCRFVLLYGAGDRGFCAGGDIKALAGAVEREGPEVAVQILEEEYKMLLRLHGFSKPVIVLADGITMGAGLGLAAAADMRIATERTRMAMPETRIGFFPDVGSTGWMFDRCPPGYPEYLGLTGYEMAGAEAVRVGFASCLVIADRLPELIDVLEGYGENLSQTSIDGTLQLTGEIAHFFENNLPANPDMDEWVATYFAGKSSVVDIMASLRTCTIQSHLCEQVFQRLAERSPTAVVLTLKLLRHNEHRRLEEVFLAELNAARFILNHPDYVEGVRARLVDKDDNPRWRPMSIETVGFLDLEL